MPAEALPTLHPSLESASALLHSCPERNPAASPELLQEGKWVELEITLGGSISQVSGQTRMSGEPTGAHPAVPTPVLEAGTTQLFSHEPEDECGCFSSISCLAVADHIALKNVISLLWQMLLTTISLPPS